jgi:hypothetical protein
MFSSYTVASALQLTMVDPPLATNNKMVQKGVIFFIISTQNMVTDVQMVTPLPLCELFLKPALYKLYGSDVYHR